MNKLIHFRKNEIVLYLGITLDQFLLSPIWFATAITMDLKENSHIYSVWHTRCVFQFKIKRHHRFIFLYVCSVTAPKTESEIPKSKLPKSIYPKSKTPKSITPKTIYRIQNPEKHKYRIPKHRNDQNTEIKNCTSMWNNANQLSSYPCRNMHVSQPYLLSGKLSSFSFSCCEVVTVCSLCNWI